MLCTTFLLVTLISVIFFLEYFDAAFPPSEIGVIMEREQAIRKAENVMAQMGVDIPDYSVTATFETDQQVDYFLQRELGIAALNRLTSSGELCLHYWRIVFFNPISKQRFIVGIAPDGHFDGFKSEITNIPQRSKPDQYVALEIAETFTNDIAGLDLSDFTLTAISIDEQTDRINHSFTWAREWRPLPEIDEEVLVTLRGESVSFFERFIKVPESHVRRVRNERSIRELFSAIGNALSFLVMLSAAIYTVRTISRREEVQWQYGVFLGFVVFLVAAVLPINNMFITSRTVTTTEGWMELLGSHSIMILLSSCVLGGQVVIYSALGQQLYARTFGSGSLARYCIHLGRRRFRRLLSKCAIGYGLAFMLIAYHMSCYLIGDSVGVWMPAKPRIGIASMSHIPIIGVIGAAFLASLIEESTFRLFCIPLFKKYLRTTIAAVILSALAWGINHAGHVIFPVYFRMIEITLIGIVYGVVFIKYGFVTVLTAHYLVDAIVGVSMTFPPSSLDYNVALIVVLVLPMLVAVGSHIVRGYIYGFKLDLFHEESVQAT